MGCGSSSSASPKTAGSDEEITTAELAPPAPVSARRRHKGAGPGTIPLTEVLTTHDLGRDIDTFHRRSQERQHHHHQAGDDDFESSGGPSSSSPGGTSIVVTPSAQPPGSPSSPPGPRGSDPSLLESGGPTAGPHHSSSIGSTSTDSLLESSMSSHAPPCHTATAPNLAAFRRTSAQASPSTSSSRLLEANGSPRRQAAPVKLGSSHELRSVSSFVSSEVGSEEHPPTTAMTRQTTGAPTTTASSTQIVAAREMEVSSTGAAGEDEEDVEML